MTLYVYSNSYREVSLTPKQHTLVQANMKNFFYKGEILTWTGKTKEKK